MDAGTNQPQQEQVPQAWVDAAMDAATGGHLNEGEEFRGDELDFDAAIRAVLPLHRQQVLREVEVALRKLPIGSLPNPGSVGVEIIERDAVFEALDSLSPGDDR